MARVLLAIAVLIFVQIAFGGYAVVAKYAVSNGTNPVVFALLRDVFGGAVLLVAAKLQCMRDGTRFLPRTGDLFGFMILGLTGVWGSQLLSVLAIDRLSPINFALMQPGLPIFSVFWCLALGVESLSCRIRADVVKLGGLILASAGAMIVVVAGSHSDGSATDVVAGNVFLVMQVLCGSSYSVFQKPFMNRYPPLVVAAWGYAFGAFQIAMSAVAATATPAAWSLNLDSLWSLTYVVLISSALNYALLAWANQQVGPTVVMATYPVQVVVVATFDWVVDGVPVTLWQGLGGGVIVSGLVATLLGSHWQQKRLQGLQELQAGYEGYGGSAVVAADSGDGADGADRAAIGGWKNMETAEMASQANALLPASSQTVNHRVVGRSKPLTVVDRLLSPL